MKTQTISEWLTHIDNEDDVPYLRSKLLDVNIRLFRANPTYRGLVLQACNHIHEACITEREGYKLPHGMSGANVGIPWNIIGVAMNRGTKDAFCKIMINPKIMELRGDRVETLSNCGSIRLAKPIRVRRHTEIVVEWYDFYGEAQRTSHYFGNGAFTIQHEVDHNLGILITDRQVHENTDDHKT